MNDLSPTTRALLDSARAGLGPDASAVQRMRSGVATKVAGTAAASALAIKIGLACVIATAGVTAVVHYTRSTSAPVTAPSHVAQQAPTVAPSVAAPTVAAIATPSVATSASSASGSTVDLSREVSLIDSASAALAKGTPLTAIETIRQYSSETRGAGQLAEEAAAIDVEATCAARLPEAGTKLAAFDTRYPHSSQRARLTTACK